MGKRQLIYLVAFTIIIGIATVGAINIFGQDAIEQARAERIADIERVHSAMLESEIPTESNGYSIGRLSVRVNDSTLVRYRFGINDSLAVSKEIITPGFNEQLQIVGNFHLRNELKKYGLLSHLN